MADIEMDSVRQYLSFVLDEELYALDIAKVREVLELQSVTRIPRTPDYMCGVINLRGHAVPVVDLRLKFGIAGTGHTVDTCIIIVEVGMEGERVVLGALADSVREVFELSGEDISPAPKMGTGIRSDFIHGMAKFGERFIMILDIDKVFSLEELVAVAGSGRKMIHEAEAVTAEA